MVAAVAYFPGHRPVQFELERDSAGRPTNVPLGAEYGDVQANMTYYGTRHGTLPYTDPRAQEAWRESIAVGTARHAARTPAEEAAITGVTRVQPGARVVKPVGVVAPEPGVAEVKAGVDVYGPRPAKTRVLTQRETAERYAAHVAPFSPMMGTSLSRRFGTGEIAGERVRKVPIILGMRPTEAVTPKAPAPPAPKKKYLPTGREELEWVPPSEKTVMREEIKREAIKRQTKAFKADVAAFEERKTTYEAGPRADYDIKLKSYEADLKQYYNPQTGKYEVPDQATYDRYVKREARLSAEYSALNVTVKSLDREAQVLSNRARKIGQKVKEHEVLRKRVSPPLKAEGGVSKRPTYPVTWEGKTTEFKTQEQAQAALDVLKKIQEKKAQTLYEVQTPISARLFARPTGEEGLGESLLRGGVGIADLPFQVSGGLIGLGKATKRAIEKGDFGKPGREYLTEAEREFYDEPVATLGIMSGFASAGPALGVAGRAVSPYVPKLVQAPLAKIVAKVVGLPAPVKTGVTLTGFGAAAGAPAAYKGELTTEQWIGYSVGMGLAGGGLHAGIKAQPVRVAALKVPIKGEKIKTVYREVYLKGEKPTTVLGVTETGKLVTRLPKTIKDMPSLKKLELPEQMAINIESYPKTVLETRFLTQPKVMKELGFKPSEAVKVKAGMEIMTGLHKVKTEFVRELPKKTVALDEPGTATITSLLKKRSGEIERVRGTFATDPQTPAKYAKVPSDIDVALKGGYKEAVAFGEESVAALKAKGYDARVDVTGGHVKVMVEKGGVSKKAVEFSYVGEPPELAVGLGAESAKEMRYGLKAVKKPVGFEGLPMTQLGEQVIRWPATAMTWWKKTGTPKIMFMGKYAEIHPAAIPALVKATPKLMRISFEPVEVGGTIKPSGKVSILGRGTPTSLRFHVPKYRALTFHTHPLSDFPYPSPRDVSTTAELGSGGVIVVKKGIRFYQATPEARLTVSQPIPFRHLLPPVEKIIEPPLHRPADVAKAWGAGKTLLERGRALKVLKEPKAKGIEEALETWRTAKWVTPGVERGFKAMEKRGAPKTFELEYPKSLIKAEAPSLLRPPSAARPSVSSLGAVSFKSFASATSRASQSTKSSVSSSVSSVASLASKAVKPSVSVPSRVSVKPKLPPSAFGYPSLRPSRPYAPSRPRISFAPSIPSPVSGAPSPFAPSPVSGPSAPFGPPPPPPPPGFVPFVLPSLPVKLKEGFKPLKLPGRTARYAPSLLAQVFKVRGKPLKGLLTGLEIRPLPAFKPVKPPRRGRKRK